ncbi:MAG: hypothetical protein KG003_04550 [Bacteroidetes bacterium]|nr:hypothetical protein [Bacteroidota bacterium]
MQTTEFKSRKLFNLKNLILFALKIKKPWHTIGLDGMSCFNPNRGLKMQAAIKSLAFSAAGVALGLWLYDAFKRA